MLCIFSMLSVFSLFLFEALNECIFLGLHTSSEGTFFGGCARNDGI